MKLFSFPNFEAQVCFRSSDASNTFCNTSSVSPKVLCLSRRWPTNERSNCDGKSSKSNSTGNAFLMYHGVFTCFSKYFNLVFCFWQRSVNLLLASRRRFEDKQWWWYRCGICCRCAGRRARGCSRRHRLRRAGTGGRKTSVCRW